ncbi:kinase-like domain-containing protein [Aspergillus multicolor]|uniref:kinase-like domain-containing protein n=1 Tax=Aspergillus multicolor TaxID=41759 RepID=UPI003CCD4C8B
MPRFETIRDVVEPVEEYRRGGYHPVHLEDTIGYRYKVIAKLSFGQFSTIWLARDKAFEKTQHFIALKILKANNGPEGNTEGPNGLHLCLVFPVVLGDCHDLTVTAKPRNAAFVRSVSKQILLGLQVVHDEGFIHCDLPPANILIAKAGTTEDGGEGEAPVLYPPEFSPVQWLDGVTVDDSAPRYLVHSQRRRGALDEKDFSILLSTIGDLGSDRTLFPLCHEQWTNAVFAVLALPREMGYQDRFWALGCLIFELATNEPLFSIGTFGLSHEDIDTEHLRQIEQVLGGGLDGFVTYLAARLPADFGAGNTRCLAAFLLLMLQQDPPEEDGDSRVAGAAISE